MVEAEQVERVAHADRFAMAPRIAFEQAFLGEGADAEAVEAARSALTSGADPAGVGAPTLLPPSLELAPASVIDSAFGPGFFDAIASFAGFGIDARALDVVPLAVLREHAAED